MKLLLKLFETRTAALGFVAKVALLVDIPWYEFLQLLLCRLSHSTTVLRPTYTAVELTKI